MALGRLWHTRAHPREGRYWLEQAFAAHDTDLPDDVRAATRYAASVLAHYTGDDDQAIASATACLPLFRILGNSRGEADALNILGLAYRQMGDLNLAETFFAQSLAVWRTLADPRSIGMGLLNLASLEADRSNFAAAIRLTEESIPLLEAAGDALFLGIALANQGGMHVLIGEYQAARPLLTNALGRCRATSNWRILSILAQCVAFLAHAEGRTTAAIQLLGAEDALRAITGVPTPAILRPYQTHVIDSARAALDNDTFAAAWSVGQRWSAETLIERALALVERTPPVATQA